jgi:hypothetical protein
MSAESPYSRLSLSEVLGASSRETGRNAEERGKKNKDEKISAIVQI